MCICGYKYIFLMRQSQRIAVHGVWRSHAYLEDFFRLPGPCFIPCCVTWLCLCIDVVSIFKSRPQAEIGDLLFSPGHLLTVARPSLCPLTPSSLPPSLQSICCLPALPSSGSVLRMALGLGQPSAAAPTAKRVAVLSLCHRRSPQ